MSTETTPQTLFLTFLNYGEPNPAGTYYNLPPPFNFEKGVREDLSSTRHVEVNQTKLLDGIREKKIMERKLSSGFVVFLQ